MNVAAPRGFVTVGVRELKNKLSAHLEFVKNGQEVRVTQHGRPVARLCPVGVEVDKLAELVEAGILRPPESPLRRLPAERVSLTDGGSLDDDVAAQRR